MLSSIALDEERARPPRDDFFATIGVGKKNVVFFKKQIVFPQGDPADSIFYIQEGKIHLTVVSKTGKEATLGLLADGEFFGEGSLAGQALRMGSATAITDCEIVRIEKKAMMEALHREPRFSDMFVACCHGISAMKRIWSTSSSIPAKKDWRGFCSCWLISARKGYPKG
jgi:CRP-like cAMP-binding protein